MYVNLVIGRSVWANFLALVMFLILATDAMTRPAPKNLAAIIPPATKTSTKSPTAKTGTGRVLVLLVEFAGNDTTTWSATSSHWDPIGKCDPNEFYNTAGDVTQLAKLNGLETTHPLTFNYSGPLHNTIPRPLSASDPSGEMVWTPDFSLAYYQSLIFGNGVRLNYKRQDNSQVVLDFTGRSLNDYLKEMSNGQYQISGEVIGWLQLPHSVWWYGADQAPGNRSIPPSSGYNAASSGYFPQGGSASALIRDALSAAKAQKTALDWKSYDQDQNGNLDNLIVIFAGLSENAHPTVLNRTAYGEGTMPPMRGSIAPWPVYGDGVTTVSASNYLFAPENTGLSDLARTICSAMGATNLAANSISYPSVGFWSPMGDPEAGYPLGLLPAALDPLNLDDWGWLNPEVISDLARIYTVTLGQAGDFPGAAGLKRGVKISLPEGHVPLAVKPEGTYYWYGGAKDFANSMMTLKQPFAIPATGPTTLTLRLAYSIEDQWDFLWIQASGDGGVHWDTLANKHTRTDHAAGWIGSLNGFPDDLAAAGIGGFTGDSPGWPARVTEAFDLSKYAGKNILLRFWYMTDWATIDEGVFLENVGVVNGYSPIFFDDGESGGDRWTYAAPWIYCDGTKPFTHEFYLQWRNTGPGGGFDGTLGDTRWHFGPIDSGLLVWYHNNYYSDNDVFNHLFDFPGFGPKGRLLLVDAHPEPCRDPYWVGYGYANEGANITSRMQMRDAAFSRNPGADFTLSADYVATTSTTHIFPGTSAISRFSDGEGYYPGAEYVSRGPGYVPPSYKWVTGQWDSSAVMPSKVFYGVKAPGYTKNQEWRYNASRYLNGRLSAYWLGSNIGLGYDGGSGRPRDVGGQYGWNVQITDQSDTTATLVIWNELGGTTVTATTDQYVMSAVAPEVDTNATGGVLANDSGPAGWRAAARAELIAPAQYGTLTLRPDGGFTYRLTDKTKTSDHFTYRIATDFDQRSSPTLVTLRHTSGSLAVTLSPPEAVTAGAQWRRNGTTLWRNSATTETGVLTGTYALEFKSLAGWNSPAAKNVTVSRGQTAKASGTYVRQTGGLKVTLTPATGQWRRVGTSTWRASSFLEQGIPTGSCNVEFKDLADWHTPARRTATITNAKTTTLSQTYIGYVAISTVQTMVLVKPGQTALFQALVSGTPVIGLQWKKNGVAIDKATTATYAIASCQAANQGLYTCVAHNTYGTTQTTGISLVVNNQAPILGYLLGIYSNPAGLDLNGDKRIDVADLTISVRKTPPDAPTSPKPASGAIGVALTPLLDWADCFRAVKYDLMLWKATASKPGQPTVSGLSVSQWTVPTPLAAQTSYRWQVIARGDDAQTTGSVWTLKTK